MYSASKSVHSASLFLHFVMLQPKWISISPSTFYTQHLIMTTQKTYFSFFLIKIKTDKSHVFTAFAQHFVDAPFGAITASSLLQYEATSLAHLSSWFHPFLFAAPLKLLQVGWETLVHSHFQISPEMFNWILVCLGHSKTFTELL